VKGICGMSCDDQASFNSFYNVSCTIVNETAVPGLQFISLNLRSGSVEAAVHVCTFGMNSSIRTRFLF